VLTRTDWYHDDYFSILEKVVSNGTDANPAPASDNNLINGKNNFDCTTVASGDKTPCVNNAGISKFSFKKGKTHRLRLINAGAEGIQRFSIDGHSMSVIANDFVPIKPYTTNVVTLGVGQRADVLVTANGDINKAYYMRSNISAICSISKNPNAVAAIYYDKADTTKLPTSSAWNSPDPGTCGNDDLSLTTPYYSITPTSNPATTYEMDINFEVNATGHFLWTLDGTSFRANYNNPVLLLANEKNLSFEEEWNVKNFGSNSSIRIIINNPTPAAHPMHLHGHNMQILAAGTGSWDGTIVNAANPQRRDVQLVPPNGYFVFQFDTDNPGVWPFHCHIAWHVSGGLYANILERPADITEQAIPYVMQQTCRDWTTYSNKAIVDQIDSGL
jgi:FtsP/CotA-like multicopper oxidase with cupredoxin domain